MRCITSLGFGVRDNGIYPSGVDVRDGSFRRQISCTGFSRAHSSSLIGGLVAVVSARHLASGGGGTALGLLQFMCRAGDDVGLVHRSIDVHSTLDSICTGLVLSSHLPTRRHSLAIDNKYQLSQMDPRDDAVCQRNSCQLLHNS